jgi:hypothetical protein
MDPMSFDWRNAASRAAWTFVETFIGTLPVVLPSDLDQLAKLVVPASIAGLASVLSVIKTIALEQLRKLKEQANDGPKL